MCQNWYSVIGQVLDVIGFLTIAWEWRFGYRDIGADITSKIEAMLDKKAAAHAGEPYVDNSGYELQYRHVQQWIWEEYSKRGWIFLTGVVLVVLGFLFQLLGNWPHLFRSC
jgi:hypothetical protein